MTAKLHTLSGLHGHGLAAFKAAGDVIAAARKVAHIHPRIHLESCYLCNGSGRHLIRHAGRVVESTCANCSGRGTIARDA